MASGRFRADLYRLNVFPITVPPLRARREDIPALAVHFLARVSRKLGRRITRIAPAAFERLVNHSWPGNVRDLQNAIELAAVLATGEELRIDWDLGPQAVPGSKSGTDPTKSGTDPKLGSVP